jgi:hypothetical protein
VPLRTADYNVKPLRICDISDTCQVGWLTQCREKLSGYRGARREAGPPHHQDAVIGNSGLGMCWQKRPEDSMKDEVPVRRHMKISARSSAQLELRLHWFTRALAIRGGYIVATARRSSGTGRHMAAVAYELPLPNFPRPSRGAGHGAPLPEAAGRSEQPPSGQPARTQPARSVPSRSPEYSRGPESSRSPESSHSRERRRDAAHRIVGEWPVRQEQGSSSGAL